MHQSLIVARMKPDSAPDIAKVFAESDRGELPHLIGVSGRSLFQFGDVYLHLIESEQDPAPAIARLTGHPEFRGISEQLSAYVSAYDPETWRSPKDAMAHCFYRWEREAGGRTGR
ncbi:TcmI family type II polyketide cyclase [Streptomyces sp. YIM S03343]